VRVQYYAGTYNLQPVTAYRPVDGISRLLTERHTCLATNVAVFLLLFATYMRSAVASPGFGARRGVNLSLSESKGPRGHLLPPTKKNPGKIVLVKYHVKFRHFPCFSYIHFRAKMSYMPKLTELLYTPITKLTYNTQKPARKSVCTCEK